MLAELVQQINKSQDKLRNRSPAVKKTVGSQNWPPPNTHRKAAPALCNHKVKRKIKAFDQGKAQGH